MIKLSKSIEYYQDDKYRDLPYGTIYYVAGTLSPYIDNLFRDRIPAFIDHLNQLTDNYLTCNIVYLEPKNNLFKTKYVSAFYSPILPTRINYAKGHSFFVATLENCTPEELEEALMKYYSTLLEIFDAILDHGSFPADLIYDHLRPQIEFMIEPSKPEPFPQSLSRLEITPTTYDVLLPDYNRSFHFTAQVKALYVLFLLHPEGILMKEFDDYKEQYRSLYFRFTNRSDMDKLHQSIDKLFNVFSPNALNVKKSQCNKEIRYVIRDDEWNKYYVVEAPKGREHKILLDRSLVSMPDLSC